MYRYHTQQNRWHDIRRRVTIDREENLMTRGDRAETLKPHLVKMAGGRLSEGSESDLNDIFEQHVPAFQRRHPERPLGFVLYIQSGLLDAPAALAQACRQVAWWKANGLYPVIVQWENGILNSITGLLARSRHRALATPAIDGALDLMTERLVRPEGMHAWTSIRQNAERACEPELGGAWVLSRKLALLRNSYSASVHAVAHSAGAILLAHLIPAALAAGLGSFRTGQLLGPALRLDAFSKLVGPLIGRGIDELTVYGLSKRAERSDYVSRVYHKSLLYLISHALETAYNVPLLGLEESLPGDLNSAARFVWNKSGTHAGLDDDPQIMNEVLVRILEGRDPPYCPYQQEHRNHGDHSDPGEEEQQEPPVAA